MDNLLSPQTSLALLQASQSDSTKSAKALKAATDAKELENVEAAAQDFEAVFVSEMLKPMFEGIETDGMFGGGKGEDVFRGMMLQEYGKLIAQTGSIGLSAQIKDAMIQMQAEADGAAAASRIIDVEEITVSNNGEEHVTDTRFEN